MLFQRLGLTVIIGAMLVQHILAWQSRILLRRCHTYSREVSARAVRAGAASASAPSLSMSTKEKQRSIIDQASAAGIASAAVVAATAVNAAVGMRQLSAPDAEKTLVYKDGASGDRIGKVDEYGLPLVYDKDLIQQYWKSQGSALTRRWAEFLGYAVPYLTKVITMVVSGGTEELQKNGAALAKDARRIFEELVGDLVTH